MDKYESIQVSYHRQQTTQRKTLMASSVFAQVAAAFCAHCPRWLTALHRPGPSVAHIRSYFLFLNVRRFTLTHDKTLIMC